MITALQYALGVAAILSLVISVGILAVIAKIAPSQLPSSAHPGSDSGATAEFSDEILAHFRERLAQARAELDEDQVSSRLYDLKQQVAALELQNESARRTHRATVASAEMYMSTISQVDVNEPLERIAEVKNR